MVGNDAREDPTAAFKLLWKFGWCTKVNYNFWGSKNDTLELSNAAFS